MRSSIFFLLLSLVCSIAAFGQSPQSASRQTGTLTGVVQSPEGMPLAGAVVKVENLSTGDIIPAMTDLQGRFNIPNLETGFYRVRIRRDEDGAFVLDQSVRVESGAPTKVVTFTYQARLPRVPIVSPNRPLPDNPQSALTHRKKHQRPGGSTESSIDVLQRTFDSQIDFQRWLNNLREQGTHTLTAIIPISNKECLIALEPLESQKMINHYVEKVSGEVTREKVEEVLRDNSDKRFVGLAYLTKGSEFLVVLRDAR
ncbi:MAG TPA: carboxypeptidase-like regulatory domain-containing protein [Pyrinomonadaceae bacterium]